VRPAHPEEIRNLLGASAGSLGGVGAKAKARAANSDLRIVADSSLKNRRNMTTGANKDDHHLRGVDISRDIPVDEWFELRTVEAGEGCPRCETGTLEVFKGMEIGHIFKLGTKYSESMGARVLTAEGKETPVVMGSYGIGVERILAAAIETGYDEAGIAFPVTIAPFQIVVTPLNTKSAEIKSTADRIYEQLVEAYVDVLYDDRNDRAGVKLNDADLVGFPFRITIGEKKLKEGMV